MVLYIAHDLVRLSVAFRRITSNTKSSSPTGTPPIIMPIALSPVHAGTARYQTARARDQQSGAVEERAQQVHTENLRHARQLDRRYHPQASPPVTITPAQAQWSRTAGRARS